MSYPLDHRRSLIFACLLTSHWSSSLSDRIRILFSGNVYKGRYWQRICLRSYRGKSATEHCKENKIKLLLHDAAYPFPFVGESHAHPVFVHSFHTTYRWRSQKYHKWHEFRISDFWDSLNVTCEQACAAGSNYLSNAVQFRTIVVPFILSKLTKTKHKEMQITSVDQSNKWHMPKFRFGIWKGKDSKGVLRCRVIDEVVVFNGGRLFCTRTSR